MDLKAYLCPMCLGPLGAGASSCDRCRSTFAPREVRTVSMDQLIAIQREACPKCLNLIAVEAKICPECGVRRQPGEKAPAVPPEIQMFVTAVTYQDSEIVAVLPRGGELSESDVGPRFGAAGLWGSLARPERDHHRGARWQLEGRISVPGTDNPVALTAQGEERGWPVKIWALERLSGLAPFLVQPDPAVRARLDGEGAAVGISMDSGNRGIAALQVQLGLLRLLVPQPELILDLAAGNVVRPDFAPRELTDGYAIYAEGEGGVLWLHTRGLSRWGAPELEWFDVPEVHRAAAAQELRAAAAVMMGQRLGPPTEPFRSASGRMLRWSPPPPRDAGTPGRHPTDRARFPHGSVALRFAE